MEIDSVPEVMEEFNIEMPITEELLLELFISDEVMRITAEELSNADERKYEGPSVGKL